MAACTRIKHDTKEAWLSDRHKDVTSTQVAALFGCSPYTTPFKLWHEKQASVPVAITQSERMTWGTRLESAVATGIAEDEKLTVRRLPYYIRNEELRLGASFDYEITGSDGLLEVKTVDGMQFKRGWIVDGEHVEAPPHIELQVALSVCAG